ncbi:tetratricopeptide repeat protein [Leeia aquatica]|uniref:Tetratricopeptide repeat protein n=1 Tax=Leeia aquatica TaxID=2725557 RepID=A0A847SGJ6_9NEIS|nr:tetratricopeptide repeat protein [Leeia aquatica]NLR75062.1 tetratricopeptide repeat protein [Leeia aquatica]
MPNRPLRLIPLCLVLALTTARADEAQDISALIKQGQSTQALERANQYLVKDPKNAKVRFAKGLALVDLNKPADAIKVFQGLTEDYPELPEPYNNLAVLYAQQKQFDKARQALEMSIQTHPSYATAHENLGDIYAQMASQAYSRALQLDKNNANAQTKLTLIRDLFTKPGAPLATVKPTAPVVVATAKPEPVKPEPVKTEPAKPAATVTTPATKPVKPDATTPAVKVEPSKPEPAKTEPAKPAASSRDDKPVLQATEAWAQAWSKQKVGAYLSAYGSSFKPPRGMSRSAWEAERRERLTASSSISVSIGAPKVSFIDDNTARVTFTQSYKSDTLKTSTGKTLIMTRNGDRWLITEERVGR